MKRMNVALMMTLTTALLATAACSRGSAGVRVQARGSQTAALQDGTEAPAATDSSGQTLVVQSAQLNLRDIELTLPAGVRCADIEAELQGARCENDDEDDTDSEGGETDVDSDADSDGDESDAKVIIDGPILVDLVAGTSEPSLAEVRVPALSYARVDLRVDDDGALGEHSFVGVVETVHEGAPLTVQFRFDIGEDIRVEQEGGVAVAPDASLLIAFVVDSWFTGADLAACLNDEEVVIADGVVLIDEESDDGAECDELEDTIEENMVNNLDLSDDSDEDSDEDGEDEDGEDEGDEDEDA